MHEDPYPTYGRLREEAPLYRNDEFDFWALSRHHDVLETFRDVTRFSNRFGVSLDPAVFGPEAHKSMSFLAMDPPRHTRMRSLVSRGFTPRRVAELEPRIRQIAVSHLVPALEKGEFDMIADFAGRVPMDVISELLGVPEADRAEIAPAGRPARAPRGRRLRHPSGRHGGRLGARQLLRRHGRPNGDGGARRSDLRTA